MSEQFKKEAAGFAALGLAHETLATLSRNGYTVPTPIQIAAIPAVLGGRDIVGIAQTGTGKTLAFSLPLVERMLAGQVKRALIIAPTRELALQIDETLQKVAQPRGVRSTVVIGGASMNNQRDELGRRPRIVVATPGRLLDHMSQGLKLTEFDAVVLDEADRMLDMGFAPSIKKILAGLPQKRHTMLFSATFPSDIEAIAATYQRDPIRVEVASAGTATELVEQELRLVAQEEKGSLLGEILADHDGTTLVFARTRHGARKLARVVRNFGHTAAELHSDRSLAQRKAALEAFKRGEVRVLVATDIAARGIDVKGIGLVVNYDLPDNPEDYVHRIGRTGRAGASGRAVTFALAEQERDVRDIEKTMRLSIPRAPGTPATFGKPQEQIRRPSAKSRPAAPARPAGGPAKPAGGPAKFHSRRPR